MKKRHVSSAINFDINLTAIGILVTLAATLLFVIEAVKIEQAHIITGQRIALLRDCVFIVIVLCLIYGGLVYLITRIGYFRRKREYIPASKDEIDKIFDKAAPDI